MKLKQVSRSSGTGGTITEYFNEQGQRVKVVHQAGKSYSGESAPRDDQE